MKPKWIVWAVVLALGVAPCAWATESGALFVRVQGADGTPLVGATVELAGTDFSRAAVSSDRGEARFTNIRPGSYDVTVALMGYTTVVQEGVKIDFQSNVDLKVVLDRSQIVERVVVTAQTPLMDTRKTGTSTVLSKTELDQVPTSRDPWAVLSTIPGIMTDRVNIAGSEAGQQSNYVGKGDDGAQSSWVMDGVEFTDVAAAGSSSTYLDFNSFDQVGFVTGGADVEQPSPGLRLNFITKQGSNRHTGTARLLYAERQYQTNNLRGLSQPPNVTSVTPISGNKVNENFEKNFDLGGPIVQDKAWYWFGFTQNDINVALITGQADITKLRNISGKVHGQVGSKTTWKAYYSEGDKIKTGRGGGIDRPPETTWNQEGPTPIYTGLVNHFFSPNFEMTLQAGSVGGGFSLTPQGDFSNQIFQDEFGVYSGTFSQYATKRPQDQFTAKGSYYKSTGDWDHEFKFGFRYKTTSVNSFSKYSENDLVATKYYTSSYGGDGYVYLYRELNTNVDVEYYNAWIGDTVIKGPWTFSGGLHFSRQSGEQLASSSPASALAPTLLEGVDFGGFDPGFTWNDISPRLGVTYTFDTANRALVRGSFSRYVDQLGSGLVSYNLPLTYVGVFYAWDDLNDNDFFDGIGEIVDINSDTTIDCLDSTFALNIDPCNTASAVSPFKIDRNLEAPYVNELIFGGEYELMRDFSVAANVTFRERKNIVWTPLYDLTEFADTGRLVTLGSDIYDCSGTVSGNFLDTGAAYDEPFCQIVDFSDTDGTIRWQTNMPGFKQSFQGIELTATKRLSNKWMMRGYVAYSDWTNEFSGTPLDPGIYGTAAGSRSGDPTNSRGGTTDDGGAVAVQSLASGNKRNVWTGSSKWQVNVNGLYQLPMGVSVAGNLYGRQGYGIAYFHSVSVGGAEGTKAVQIDGVDSRRYDDLWTLDLRAAKLFSLDGGTKIEVAVDAFNVFNENTVLQLDSRVDAGGTGTYNRIGEILSPRVFRFGATISF